MKSFQKPFAAPPGLGARRSAGTLSVSKAVAGCRAAGPWRAKTRSQAVLALGLALACARPLVASADDYYLHTDYENLNFSPGPASGSFTNYFGANASTALYGGHLLGNSTATLPTDGVRYGLEWSAFGQAVEGIQSDVALGDVIAPPPSTDTNQPPANFVPVQVGDNTNAYYVCTDPQGGAFWVPSTHQIIATQPDNITIAWHTTNGGTNIQVVNVNAVPVQRPARLFWTEEPYDAPIVSLHGLFPAIHYNTQVPPPTYQVTTTTNGGFVISTTNIISGVWLDAQKQLHAKNVSGTFILEYYQEGTYKQQVQPSGIEVVQVLEPDLQVVTANVGQRLMPVDTYWAQLDGINGLLPNVTEGINVTAYLNNQTGPKNQWVYAIQRTWSEPWTLEIYWQHTGCMGVVWPYEVDWYSCDWPAYPQRYIIGDNPPADSAPVFIPSQLTATVMPDMDPPLMAKLSGSGRSFNATQPGYCLLKYTTSDNIWFEVVQSVSHTNPVYSNLDPEAWPIGTELSAGDPAAHALRFDGTNDYVSFGTSFINLLPEWTLALRFKATRLANELLYAEGINNSGLQVQMGSQGQLKILLGNQVAGDSMEVDLPNGSIHTNQWQQLSVTLSGGSDTNGTLTVAVDGTVNVSPARRVNSQGAVAYLAGSPSGGPGLFQGAMDELRIWTAALTSDQISSNRYVAWPQTAGSLVADFPFYEGQGQVYHNLAGEYNGSANGNPTWCFGELVPLPLWSSFPGFIHLPEGNRYNVNRYTYPTEAAPNPTSDIFAVNTGQLEVWWANLSLQSNMPPVYYPSRVVRYTNSWPTDPPQIVIASGLGTSVDEKVFGSPTIYSQNDPSQPGYNPNEEHALIMGGVAYALRNDLNTTNSSDPFVLVDYLDPTNAHPAMMAFSVVATNSQYAFQSALTAGEPIVPIMPLGAMPLCTNTFSDNSPPAWRDRKTTWWAISGGDDGGITNAVMHFYYQMQPTFNFPDLALNAQPPIGQELPWLPTNFVGKGASGIPVPFVCTISWPADPLPELQLGQTLTAPANGLPDIWDQLSVDVKYDQSKRLGLGDCVTLFDPVAATGIDLDPAVISAMTKAQLARQDATDSYIRFPNLPPSIYQRLYYDPNRGASGQLVLEGQNVSTLTGSGYLLLNLLEPFEKDSAIAMVSALDPTSAGKWTTAVTLLPGQVTPIVANTPYVNAALGARLTNGTGYVTLVFNNSTNTDQVASSDPISLSIIKVVPQLYSGVLEVIQPADALAEELSMRYSADLAGQVSTAQFEWRWVEPNGGLIPNTNFDGSPWSVYGTDPDLGTNEISLSGANPFVMSDHYFAVRYRPAAQNGPSGTNWSDWSYNLAPGWVKRAMTGVNPFEQIFQDTVANAVDTRVSMISQAGGPYEGDVALNLPAASDAGLIPTYETIFNRAKSFSINADLNDPALNQTLLFAASRLRDLYTLLGDEAFADSQDPTIAFPTSLSTDQHGGDSTSIFCFMNQEPNLLEEELALLRGRDDTLALGVRTSPIYNRLLWNFTQGINGGEAAYAYNYNIRGTPTNTVGVITAADAKRYYPQGHGDAWGHYLSAIMPYYDLLSNTNFGWQTLAESTLVGNATVSVDYLDEQKFAETAAARARTGIAIVQQTFRERYTEGSSGLGDGYADSDTNRAWGIGEWASRAGQAALYDWAVANSLMLDRLTNMTQVGGADALPEGIQKIDRGSTPELAEVAQSYQAIQTAADNANGGLNPLGLARNVVPFDIDPSQIDAGQTHFEQIYSRAQTAVYNACVAFDHARGATQQLRAQSDSTGDLEDALAENETDFHNQLIDIFGYPYPDDIGPGKNYPQGYNGPDLVDWQILDLDNLLANAPTGQVMTVQVYNLGFTSGNSFTGTDYTDYTNLPNTSAISTNNIGTISVAMADNGLKVKPSSWKSHRPAQGELQLAMSDFVTAWYGLDSKIADYNQSMAQLQTDLDHLQADYVRNTTEWAASDQNDAGKKATASAVAGLEIAANVAELAADAAKDMGDTASAAIPQVIAGLVAILPIEGTIVTPGELGVAATTVGYWASVAATHATDIAAKSTSLAQELANTDLESSLTADEYRSLLTWNTADTLVELKQQYSKQADLLAQVEAVSQSYQRVQKLLSDGQLLITQRAQVRARAAQRIQMNRYADLSFRIFRNDALRRYQQTFDLAARYTYLAAKAYDYETGLLSSDTSHTPGSQFLQDVVRARLPGSFYVWLGTPLVGGASGEPGLADILARMMGDWNVVKGRYGFNNPEVETSRFSLRGELYRTSPTPDGDSTWAQTLENCMVADLHQMPEFIRYCRPYTDTTNVEPALVIPFSTSVVAGRNYFGNDLAGGDNAYDPSHQATKIRSAGIWFTGYNNSYNTNGTGAGLANEPRVYLIPIGDDVMRSPTRDGVATRSWTILDQAIPLPYNVGSADVDNPDWIPIMDSLREPLAQIRQYDSLRAYHDAGNFDQSQTCSNSRLIGRSVWNTRWLLIIPGRTLLSDPNEGLERFINGSLTNSVSRDGNGVKDIKIFFQTYSTSGN